MANPLVSSLNTLARWFVPQPPDLQERSEFPTMEEQIAAIRRTQAAERPWRAASVTEALGVPAILSAVTLISGTVGSLSMEGYRNGSLMTTDSPRLIQRPNPRSTPREFFRDTAFYLATRGEAWWWIAHRDIDGNPDALYPIPPFEIMVELNQRDRLNPTIKWGDRVMRNEDIRQLTYLTPGANGRGLGPLQLAGAAVSVTVEADHWAANFFSGNLPSLVGTTDQDLDELDLKALDAQWAEKQGNTPRWMTQGMKLEAAPFDAEKAQLTDTRQHQVGEWARAFVIPGPLLEYQMSGSSLTYRTEEGIWSDFQKRCLSPIYLEPIEQHMSDLLPRTTSGRFNLKQLLRADPKTRSEIHKNFIDSGVYGPDTAAKEEGYEPGNVDFAPVPFSPPAADLSPIPIQNRSIQPGNCTKCNKHLADAAPPGWSTTCPRCKTFNSIPIEPLQERADPITTALTAISMREPRPPEVNVTIESGAIAAPDMSGLVEAITALASREQPTPQGSQTTFAEGAFHSEIHVPEIVIPEPAPVEPPVVNVQTDSFAEAVREFKEIMAAPKTRTVNIIRDDDGRMVRVEEVA